MATLRCLGLIQISQMCYCDACVVDKDVHFTEGVKRLGNHSINIRFQLDIGFDGECKHVCRAASPLRQRWLSRCQSVRQARCLHLLWQTLRRSNDRSRAFATLGKSTCDNRDTVFKFHNFLIIRKALNQMVSLSKGSTHICLRRCCRLPRR